MGINRIRLQNGAMGDPRVDARMQQTYQQNIADNQAQQARNESIFQAARDKLQGFGNTLTGVVEGARDYTIPVVQGARALLTGAGEPIITDSMRRDLIERAQTKGGDSGFLGYEDYGLTPAGNVSGGRFGGGITDIINDPQAFANAATLGRVTYDRDPETGEYSFGDTNYDFNIADTDTGLGANLLRGINEGGLTGAVSNLLTPTTAEAAEPSAMPQGSPGQLNPTPTPDAGTNLTPLNAPLNRDDFNKFFSTGNSKDYENYLSNFSKEQKVANKNNELYYGPNQKPTMADVAGPAATGGGVPNYQGGTMVGPNLYLGPTGIYERIDPNGSYTSMGRTDPRTQGLASGGRVGFQDGSPEEMVKAQEAAASDPALDAIRQQLFGEDYVQDIGEGRGIAQYYTGFGLPQSLQFTPPAAVEEAAPVVDITQPVVDSGGGGGGGSDIDITTPDTGNTDFEQNLLDQGIGVQGAIGDPVVAPGEIPVTQQEMDDFNAPAVLDSTSTAEEIAQDLSNQQAMLNPTGGNIMDEVALTGQTDFVNPADVEAGLATESMLDFQTPEQTNAINKAFNSVKDLGAAGVDKFKDSLIALGGKVKEGFDNTIEIGGKTIDLTKSLIGGALSFATGIPGISFALNAIKEDPMQAATKQGLEEQGYGFDDIGRLTTGPMAGYNVESAFGDGISKTTLDRIDKIENRDAPQTEASIKKVQELYNFLGDVTEVKAAETAPQEDIGAISRDMNTGVDQDIINRGQQVERGTSGIGDNQPVTSTTKPGELSTSTYDAELEDERDVGGGGNQGGGSKIVCTMMNDSYGFGSFRNKIWLRHSKDLAPEYQIGYHKIFLPLVKLSKTNKILKKTLEHIAVHRTIDIRQEARGKMHLLGRIYRKILEPICYIVGKHAKR